MTARDGRSVLSRRGFLVGTTALSGSALLLPRSTRAAPTEDGASGATPTVAYVVDVAAREPRATERWVDDVLLGEDVGVAATTSEATAMLAAAAAVNPTLRARRLLLHAPIDPQLGTEMLDRMRQLADRFPLDGWELSRWCGDVAIADLHAYLDLAVRLGIRIVGLRLPRSARDLGAELAALAREHPALDFVALDVRSDTELHGLASQQLRNVWLEVGAVVSSPSPGAAIAELASTFGSDRLVWGSDLRSRARIEDVYRRLGADEQLRARLLGHNAAELYQLAPEELVPVPASWRSELFTSNRSL